MARWLALGVLVTVGCGQTHDPGDAGVDAGPRLLSTCDEFLAAEEGAPCEDIGRACGEPPGWCPRHFARCVDGRVTNELFMGPYEDPEDDPRTCAPGSADVTADELRFDGGVIQPQYGFVEEMTIVLTSGAPFWECPYPLLQTTFFAGRLGHEESHETEGRLSLDAYDVEVSGTVTVTRYVEREVLEGTLSLTGTGPEGPIVIEGSFSLNPCSALALSSI